MVVGDAALVGARDHPARRHLAVDAVHVHRAARGNREPVARPDRSRAARWRRRPADLPRRHLARHRPHRRDDRPDPPHRGFQDHRSPQRIDQRRAGPCDRIHDAARIHRLAHPGPRRLRRDRLHPAFHLDGDLRFLFQLCRAQGAEVPAMTPDKQPWLRRLIVRLIEPPNLETLAPLPRIATYAALIAWSLIVLMPLYWVVITSFKVPVDVDTGPYYLPFIDFQPSLDAWHYIFVDLGNDTLRPYFNSVVVALASTTLAILIGSLAAYALVRIRFKVMLASILVFIGLLVCVIVAVAYVHLAWQLAVAVAGALFLLFLGTLSRRFRAGVGNSDIEFWIISNRIMPPVVAVLPIYIMFQQLHLLDTHVALIATYTAVNLPIVVWLTRDFFAGVPIDLEESAEMDGASKFRVFFTIALPLVRSGLVATFMLVLILAWNEYLLALFLSNANAQTMPLLVSAQNGTRGPQWWYMSVLIVIMVAPVVVIAIFLQKHIARGLLIGAVKG